MLRGLVSAAIAAMLLILFAAPAVLAHAELVAATPGPGDTVEGSPERIVARFSQDLDPSRTQLDVRAASGERVARGGDPGASKRQFVLALPELAPGDYEVRWTSFSSEDGELARGSYTFTVTAPPTPSPTPEPSEAPQPSQSVVPRASPEATPTATVSLPTTSPAASPPPETLDASSDTTSVVLPIVAGLVVVALFAGWLLRGRRR